MLLLQGSPLEVHLAHFLVEDRTPSMLGYSDWLQTLHKAVMSR